MTIEVVDRKPRAGSWRPTVALVDLGAIRHNVSHLKPRELRLMAVVKADGYGHGDVPVARAALAAGATWLGVALVEEGVGLRDAGIEASILVLTEFPPGSESEALAAGLTPTLYSDEGLRGLEAARAGAASPGAGARGVPVRVHVKIDTGMHRVGADWEGAEGFVRRVVDAGFDIEGLWTHFAKAEELADPFTELQLERFGALVARLESQGVCPRILHAANSAAIMLRPDAHFDMVRLGVAMYGVSPGGDSGAAMASLRAAMAWRSAVAQSRRVRAGEGVSYGLEPHLERDSTIATVPVGYADGYSRLLSNRGEVLVRGRRRRVVGRVTMDQLMVDCEDDPVEAGEEVVLVGRQGEEAVTVEELAGLIGTIGHEIVCGVSERVPRKYIDG